MTGDDTGAGSEYDQPRVPSPLRERVDELFVAQRGYEPASFQEALSVVLDLAETSLDGETADAAGGASGVPGDAADGHGDGIAGTATGNGTDGSGSRADAASTGSTTDADSDASAETIPDPTVDPEEDASVSFDEYVEGLEETRQDPTPAVESILDTEHADDAVRELAAEVLDEMTQDAFRELEHGVDQGVAGVTDGMGATETVDGAGTAPSGTTGDGVPESLTADPESNCAVCGRSHPVSVLQTSILEEDGSVELVCPSCAD